MMLLYHLQRISWRWEISLLKLQGFHLKPERTMAAGTTILQMLPSMDKLLKKLTDFHLRLFQNVDCSLALKLHELLFDILNLNALAPFFTNDFLKCVFY